MKLIPPTYGPGTSSGERLLFEDLRTVDAEGVCLHSLRLSRHPTKPTSEADFVLLNSRGILVVEVKSGGVSRSSDGTWYYSGAAGVGRDNEGPFVQAETAMWALRERIDKAVGSVVANDLTFGWAVAFPQCVFDITSVEWEPDLVYDRRWLHRGGLKPWVAAAQRHWSSLIAKKPAPQDSLDRVLRALRPDFQVVPALSARAGDVDQACKRLTDEQIAKLEIIEGSLRIICSGGAGTGKSFLAAETTRQHLAEGRAVVLMVPTRQLAAYLGAQPGLGGGTVRVIGPRPPAEPRVDVMVVDEAQDVLDFAGLEMLGDRVEGGLEQGRWRLFLDPNVQARLIGRFDPEALTYLESLGAVSANLRTNCRNTTEIVEHVGMLTGADIGVPTVALGSGVTIREAPNRSAAAKLLAAHLRRLSDEGVENGEIVILSHLAPGESCIGQLPRALRDRISTSFEHHTGAGTPGHILFASPSTFKGLESRFVCLVDVEEFGGSERGMAELYIALTRARASLWMCVAEALAPAIDDAVRRNLGQRNRKDTT